MKNFRLLALLLGISVLFISATKKSKIKVACVGDSITEGFGLTDPQKYPAILQNYLGSNYEVRNFGVSGRTLLKKGTVTYWNESKYQEALDWQPDIVVIKLGTNDSKPVNWKFKDEFYADFLQFIKSFKQLPGKQKIYVCYPIPVFEEKWGINDKAVKREIIPLIKKAAKKTKVNVVDLYTPFAGKNSYTSDGVHPNAEGSELLASLIYNAIK